jgi:hypothetical protein
MNNESVTGGEKEAGNLATGNVRGKENTGKILPPPARCADGGALRDARTCGWTGPVAPTGMVFCPVDYATFAPLILT